MAPLDPSFAGIQDHKAVSGFREAEASRSARAAQGGCRGAQAEGKRLACGPRLGDREKRRWGGQGDRDSCHSPRSHFVGRAAEG